MSNAGDRLSIRQMSRIGCLVWKLLLDMERGSSSHPTALEVERATRCMDIWLKRHPGVRWDPDPGATGGPRARA